MTMAKNVYVHAGSKSGLERVLREVKVECSDADGKAARGGQGATKQRS